MLFRVAGLAFFFELVLALKPLDDMDWSIQISLPPNCRTCQAMFDDHWMDESARLNLCSDTQTSLMLDSSKCREALESEEPPTSGYQLCALAGVCPSHLEHCLSLYDQAMLEPGPIPASTPQVGHNAPQNAEYIPLTTTEKQNALCKSFQTYFGVDVNGCRGSFEKYSDTAESFCTTNEYFMADDKGGVVEKICNNPVTPIACHATNGVLSQIPAQVEFSVVDASIGVSKTYFILDYCRPTQSCLCNEGFTGAGCATAVTPTFIDTESTLGKRTRLANNATLMVHSHKAFSLSNFNMGAAVNGVPDCNGENWAYYQDSIVDEIGSQSEICGMAVRQSHKYVEVAIVSERVDPTCLAVVRTVNDQTVTGSNCQGDLLMNMETDSNGNHVPLANAMDAGRLFGVRVHETSKSKGDIDLVYGSAKFTSVGVESKGFLTTQELMDKYTQDSNGLKHHFGGGIDEYDNFGTGYLGNIGFNVLDSGSPVGRVASRRAFGVEMAGSRAEGGDYYPYADDYSRDDDIALKNIVDLDGNINGWKSKCKWVQYIQMERTALPLHGGSMLMQTAAECYNDVFAAKFDVCPVVSVTPSISVSPSSAPSISASPRVSIDNAKECECFPGKTGDFNTVALGDFKGGSDTEGKLGICGNAQLKAYSVGSKLKVKDDVSLMVGGDLDFASGDVIFGNVKFGGNSNVGKSVLHGLANRGQTIKRAPLGSLCDDVNLTYKSLALELAQFSSYGFRTQERGDLIVHRMDDGADDVVFLDVDCAELPPVNHLKFLGVVVGETLVVNFRPIEVAGELTCNVEKMMIDVADPSRTVFNFGFATNVTIDAVSIDASVLAPLAHVSGKGGVINGQSVFGSFAGVTQQNLHPCIGCLSVAVRQPLQPPSFARMHLNDQTLSPQ